VYEEVYLDEAGADRKAWVLRITDAGEGQKVKNAGSVRRLPVHEELIARGFLDFVERQQGKARLNATTSFVWVYRATAFRRFQLLPL